MTTSSRRSRMTTRGTVSVAAVGWTVLGVCSSNPFFFIEASNFNGAALSSSILGVHDSSTALVGSRGLRANNYNDNDEISSASLTRDVDASRPNDNRDTQSLHEITTEQHADTGSIEQTMPNLNENPQNHDQIPTNQQLRKTKRKLQKSEVLEKDDNNQKSPSHLFDDIPSALDSNREELLNMTEILAMDLSQSFSSSASPTIAHVQSPNPSTQHISTTETIMGNTNHQPSVTIPHSGPHYIDYETYYNNDDPPSSSSSSQFTQNDDDLYNYDDDGNGYHSQQNRPKSNPNSPNTANNSDEPTTRDFYEFIAFVCWYAFLVLCCLLPTLCAWHRRRRNARLLQESLDLIHGAAGANGLGRNYVVRSAEGDVLAGGAGNGAGLDGRGSGGGAGSASIQISELFGGMGITELDGQQQNRDWEFLEQMFSGPPTNDNNTNGNNDNRERGLFQEIDPLGIFTGGATAQRRRIIMSDILSGMSVRMVVEREERRKRERGRRLVAALKETSMEVKEWHLIPKDPSTDQLNNTHERQLQEIGNANDLDGGDIELGNMTQNQKSGTEDNLCNECKDNGSADTQETQSSDNGTDNAGIDEKSPTLQSSASGADPNTDVNGVAAVSESESGNMPSLAASSTTANDSGEESQSDEASSPQLTSSTYINDESNIDSLSQNYQNTRSSSPSPANPETSTNNTGNLPQDGPQSSPNYSSLYEVTNPYEYDDDEGEKYSALVIPYANLNNAASNNDTNTTRNEADESDAGSSNPGISSEPQIDQNIGEPRVVSPTCAICLVGYSPGCYVTWSSNRGEDGNGEGCSHVFHRDCILCWLLKKEEPLCPCCRREFVLNSVLNQGEASGSTSSNQNQDGISSIRRAVMNLESGERSSLGFERGRVGSTRGRWDLY